MFPFVLILVAILILAAAILAAVWIRQASVPDSSYGTMFAVLADDAQAQLEDGRLVLGTERALELEGGHNFRDLGGYSTEDGQRIAWGRVYRSGEMNRLTEADLTRLSELGIRLVCDLRTPGEARDRPTRLPDGASYRFLPIFLKDPMGRREVLFGRHRLDETMKRFYRRTLLDEGAPAFGRVLKLIADHENLPLVIHCTSGKDRTGITSALLLHICGVPRRTIVADYTLTNLAAEHLLQIIRDVMQGRWMPPGFRVEQLYPLFSARAEIIQGAFLYLEKQYGSVDRYLAAAVGMDQNEILRIRENLLHSS